jgi:hypothetical protein
MPEGFRRFFYYYTSLHTYLSMFFIDFRKILGGISYNVPAVCDGLSAWIRALRSKDQGRQTVPEQWRGNEAKRNDLAIAEAEGL